MKSGVVQVSAYVICNLCNSDWKNWSYAIELTKDRSHGMGKKLLSVLIIGVCAMLSLAGCSKTGKLDEGECKCTIIFVDIPKELSMLEDNIKNNLSVQLTLKNINNEKLYHITLDESNSFEKQVSLNPGVYQVYTPHLSQSLYTGITMKADVEDVRLEPDVQEVIHVYVDNPEELTNHWMAIQPMPEMLLAEKFDGIIQVNRQVFDMRDNASALLSQLDITYENKVPSYGKVELTDSEMGITVELQNESAEAAQWQSCRLIGIYVFRNNAVFPKGVTLGMAPETVCHMADGLYGEPDAFSGSPLYGWGTDDTYVIYKDEDSGDKITLTLNASGDTIRSIRYGLAQFE